MVLWSEVGTFLIAIRDKKKGGALHFSRGSQDTARNTQDRVTIPPNLLCDAPYYGSSYQPQLGLFYFNTLVEMLPVDYYLFENNWRTDFMYSFTEMTAGCGKRAQNLDQAMSKPDCPSPVSLVSTDGNPCWGPSTYENCFSPSQSNDDEVSSTRPYEILNNSRTNAILFPSDHQTVYVFTAQVLDGNYSFCNLNTTFVVMPQGYGDMPDPLSPLYMFIASVIALIAFFWAVYWLYAMSWNENRIGFQMIEKMPVPKAWHLITKGEHQLVHTGSDTGKKIFVPKGSM
ncbi:hypothetical protein RvY_02011 [Ramazzottius varieornatus]|uniref:CATSPERD/E C-terminal domain-containing protein n=1 Tax=Ramazzottius varieornatus TaxID=947166 RepID=A0A1D1UP88_RAMVA|nr:hypothetical protein RvY_02011 [Ramazzottius varieornatus]